MLSCHIEGVSTAADTTTLTALDYPFRTTRTNASNKTYEGDELYVSSAQLSSTLTAALTATGSTFTVASASGFPASTVRPYVVAIDSEWILVTLASATFTSLSRGWGGTRAAAHASGATVYVPITTPNPSDIASYVASTGVFTVGNTWVIDPGTTVPFDIFTRGVRLLEIQKAINIALHQLRYRSEFPLTLVPDGDMRLEGITNWTATNATVTKVTNSNVVRGPRSLRVLATSANGYAQSNTIVVDPTNSREWYVHVPVRADIGTARLIAYDVTNSATIESADWALRGWGTLDFQFTLPATCEALAFQYMSVASSDDTYWGAGNHYPQSATEVPLPLWLMESGDVLSVLDDLSDLNRLDDPRWHRHGWWEVREDPSNPNNPFRLHLSPMTAGIPIWFEAIRNYDGLAADAQTTFCDLEWLKLAAAVEVCRMQKTKPPSEHREHFIDLLDGKRRGQGFLHDLKIMNQQKLSTIYTSQFSRAY